MPKEPSNPPELLVVSGPNGSGKTTLAELYSRELGYPYIGADKIAAALSPEDPLRQRVEAGRRFIVEVDEAIDASRSIVVESTLSGRGFSRTMRRAGANGFVVSIVHLFLDSADTCVARVAERVQKGGHHVPEEDVRRRFPRCAHNFWTLYRPLCNRWMLMYNGGVELQMVAEGDPTTHSVLDEQLLALFLESRDG